MGVKLMLVILEGILMFLYIRLISIEMSNNIINMDLANAEQKTLKEMVSKLTKGKKQKLNNEFVQIMNLVKSKMDIKIRRRGLIIK